MSNINLIIEDRAADIGNFMVGRLLPFRKKRSVGPFVFFDHIGPSALKDDENLDVPPHPHIGLSTLTYLFEGAILHRDNLGSVMEIKAGAVNWMTAGKGVVHSERTPDYLRKTDKNLHGFQIWVGLPKHFEQIEPSFHHIAASDLPVWNLEDLSFKLIVGEVMGQKSPVPVHSKMYFLELKSTNQQEVDLSKELFGESALYILEGEIKNNGFTYGPKQLLVAKESTLCKFEMSANANIYIFGGETFPEKRFIHWNFVNSEKQALEQTGKRELEKSKPESFSQNTGR